MHDKPIRLEAICIDALCSCVVALCDQENESFNANFSTTLCKSDSSSTRSSSPSVTLVSPNTTPVHLKRRESQCDTDEHDYCCATSQSPPGNNVTVACALLNSASLPAVLGDQLLISLNRKKLLNDRTMTFFDSRRCRLENVRIEGHSEILLSLDALRMLNHHTLDSLRLLNLSSIDVAYLIDNFLSPDTFAKLKLLDLTGTLRTSFFKTKPFFSKCIPDKKNTDFVKTLVDFSGVKNNPLDELLPICKFQNLRTLIVAKTHFDDLALCQVCDTLSKLTFLDISHTCVTSISSLIQLANVLKVLIARKPRFKDRTSAASTLCHMRALQVLDLSDYRGSATPVAPPGDHEGLAAPPPACLASAVVQLSATRVEETSRLSDLQILDISGVRANFDIGTFSTFLNLHPKLRFLGLLMSNACYFDSVICLKDLKVTGEATKDQIFLALATYWQRDSFCARCIYVLFRLLESGSTHLTDEDRNFCVEHIIKGLRANLTHLSVQMAGTACLYTLCREERAQLLKSAFLTHIVDVSLDAIESHTTLQLHKNVWLTLCNDHILQSGSYDMYRCCSAALQSMVKCNDAQVTRITVAVVSILAAKIPTSLTVKLGANRTYMSFLMQLLRSKLEQQQNGQDEAPPLVADLTLKFALSALWNLTDESPMTCQCFTDEGGLEIVLKILDSFADYTVEAKVLGLLNNVAEVDGLKQCLANEHCISHIKRLLLCSRVDVSYFAAGILAHLCADVSWAHFTPTWDDCLELLLNTIRSWERPTYELVAYRSFKPFVSLLRKTDYPAVQYWALWAIHHVCSHNKERYLPMLNADGGLEALDDIVSHTLVLYPYIYELCNDVLQLLT